jgi:hypothetical protein
MREYAEAGQSGGKSAGDPVRNRNEHEHQKQDDPRDDRHIQLPTLRLRMPALQVALLEPTRLRLHQ